MFDGFMGAGPLLSGFQGDHLDANIRPACSIGSAVGVRPRVWAFLERCKQL
jgi:hypothetical protein